MSKKAGRKRAKKRTGGRGGRKYLGIIVPMVAAILCMGVLFGFVAIFTKYEKQTSDITAQLQLLSRTLTTHSLEASQGKKLGTRNDPFRALKRERSRFLHNLGLLLSGDPTTGLPAASVVNGEFDNKALAGLNREWKKINKNLRVILDRQAAVEQVNKNVARVNRSIPDMSADSHEILSILVDNNARPAQIQKASIQLMLLERIEANVNKILVTQEGGKGSKATVSAVDRFSRDAVIFKNVLEGMIKGSKEQGIRRVRDQEAVKLLHKVQAKFKNIGRSITVLKRQYTDLSDVHNAANAISASSNNLFKLTASLAEYYKGQAGLTDTLNLAAFAAGGVALLLLAFLGMRLVKEAGSRAKTVEAQNRGQQEAILRLLDEIQGLSEGDLRSEAIVTEDFTGAIADAFNSAIEELRKLVATINETSVQVSSAAQETQATAMHLAEASDHQATQITNASQAVNEMAASIEEVSKNAAESSQVAQNSVKIAQAGVTTVRRNIQGMDGIREQIQETSKRIKRLGESSQEIGDIIELINDIADQTNILSLNAAIQAAMAGEAGRGFAVVADEVQRLAERSSNATKQIEALVKTIQTDTNEAVISMEQSTANVVRGAKMAEDAGESLAEIENVSNRLAELINGITANSSQQARVANNISETMNVIQEITTQTSAGTNETAASIGNLADLANELRKSVAGFKLPDHMTG